MGSAVQWDAWGCRNELNRCMLGSIFEMATRSSRSISFKHDRLIRLSFLINTNVEKLCSHKYVVQNWRRISKAFSEICLYSFPTAIQNSSRVISRNFNRSVLSFSSSRKFSLINQIKSNLHYTRGITPKRVTSGGAHLRGLAPGLHSSEETSQRWRTVGDTVPI